MFSKLTVRAPLVLEIKKMILEPFYKKVCYWYLAFEVVLLPIMFLPLNQITVYSSIFLVFLLGLITLYHMFFFHRAASESLPLFGLWVGIFLIFGGSIFDMTATVLCCPDLSEEGNPVLVALLNHGFSLWSIYCFTFFYQILKSAIYLALWMMFLKFYPKMLSAMPYKNFFTTARWLMGGAKMGWLDFVLNKNTQFKFLLPTLGFIALIVNLIHWYAALEWLEVVPYAHDTILLEGEILLPSIFILVSVTHIKLKRRYSKTEVSSI